MNKSRTNLGNYLFSLAKKVYPSGKDANPLMKELGDMLFKLAAQVSPDKPQKAVVKTKTAVVKAKPKAKAVKKTVKKAVKKNTLSVSKPKK